MIIEDFRTVNFNSKKIEKILSVFLFWGIALVLILIAGLRPVGIDRDSYQYATYIQTLKEISLIDKEPAFIFIKYLNDILFQSNVQTFFLIFAILGVFTKFLAIQRLSKLPLLSVFAYISYFFVLHEMTQIRAGVATGFFLLSIPDIYNKNLKSFIIKFLLAFSFHYSAIIMLPLYFLNSKKISKVFFLLPIIGLIGGYSNLINIFLNTNIINILPEIFVVKIQTYLMLLELGVHAEKLNIFSTYSLTSLSILYFLLFLYTQNRLKFSYDIILIKILSIHLFILYLFLPIPVFSFRLSEFLYTIMIILLPNFILYFKERIFMLFLISLLFMYIFFKSIHLLNF